MKQEYKIVWGNSMESLADHVHIHLDEGWQCQGGVSVGVFPPVNSRSEKLVTFYQAIVREVKEEKSRGGHSF